MKFEPRFSYESMEQLSSLNIRKLLAELKSIIEKRISDALSDFTIEDKVENQGAIDNKFLIDKQKRDSYFRVCESIVDELNELGHQLLPLDIDSDIDFESTSFSWTTDWQDGNARGLDLEFWPSKVTVLWILSANT